MQIKISRMCVIHNCVAFGAIRLTLNSRRNAPSTPRDGFSLLKVQATLYIVKNIIYEINVTIRNTF